MITRSEKDFVNVYIYYIETKPKSGGCSLYFIIPKKKDIQKYKDREVKTLRAQFLAPTWSHQNDIYRDAMCFDAQKNPYTDWTVVEKLTMERELKGIWINDKEIGVNADYIKRMDYPLARAIYNQYKRLTTEYDISDDELSE